MRWVICGAIYGPNFLIVFIDILSGPKEFVPLAFLIICCKLLSEITDSILISQSRHEHRGLPL